MKKIYCFSVFLFFSVLLNNPLAGATTGFQLSPIKNEFEIAPGTIKSSSINVKNLTDKKISVDLSVEEFNVSNQNYDYIFTADSDIVKWVIFDEDTIEIEPNATSTLGYNINVPMSAEPGGRYLSIFASTNADNDDGGTIISKQRIASLIYFTVSGDVTRHGKLMSLASPFLAFDRASWSATISNLGSTHFMSTYTVEVFNFFGQSISKTSSESIIMPNSLRSIEGEVAGLFWPGMYKLEYKISMGDYPQAVEIKRLVYLPVWFIILTLLLTIVSIVRFSINKQKKSIVNQSGEQQYK